MVIYKCPSTYVYMYVLVNDDNHHRYGAWSCYIWTYYGLWYSVNTYHKAY